jgi:hypothetical protein
MRRLIGRPDLRVAILVIGLVLATTAEARAGFMYMSDTSTGGALVPDGGAGDCVCGCLAESVPGDTSPDPSLLDLEKLRLHALKFLPPTGGIGVEAGADYGWR